MTIPILDIHVTTTREHDTQIAPLLINHTAAEVGVLLGDKGYDDQQIRTMAREYGICPLIKHREFSSLQKAWNARLDTELYGQRSQSETVNSRLKRKYGAFAVPDAGGSNFVNSLLRASSTVSTELSNDQYRILEHHLNTILDPPGPFEK